ncbi:hypothetical protein FA95DRAFT_1564305 [Auriscalpium vulgare]|uniref:Uncharacterized protein n=1 Tax=Auriscalpium vulgare TaxID=40419 RepID=A0ACB8REB8_9AGAM|nr:hypothetical protein FA95DRAFT_1564305 [Auriscalpium vulgare]
MYPAQKAIILCAFSGPFWSHQFRQQVELNVEDEDVVNAAEGDLDLLEEEPEDAEAAAPGEGQEDAAAAPAQAIQDDVDLRDSPLPGHMEDLYLATQDLPVLTARWSGVYEMETLESRRYLAAIHARLRVIPEEYGTDQAWC